MSVSSTTSLAAATSLLLASAASAQLEPLNLQPIAVRGGVLVVPLRADGPSGRSSTSIRLDDGRRVEATIARVEPAAADARRIWTQRPEQLIVRSAAGDRPASRGVGQSLLLARVPDDARGAVRIGSTTVRPVWLDPPPPLASEASDAAAAIDIVPGLPDQPDPDSPFAFWRWVLLAERLQMRPPDASRYGPVGALLAEHDAALWRIGLERLAGIDVSLAERCRDLLLLECVDGQQPFAAWVADPEQLSALRAGLLDPGQSDAAVADAVRAWMGRQLPLLIWLEAEYPGSVRLALVNRGRDPVIARFAWPGRDDIPIAVELRPGVLTATDVDRPSPPSDRVTLRPPDADEPELLRIDVDERTFRLPLAPRTIVARPPAAMARTMRPPLTLVEVETGVLRPVPPDETTTAQLRRRGGRWELFFECRRDLAATATSTRWAPVSLDLPLGTEAVTVHLGPPEHATGHAPIRLTVPESGGLRLWEDDDAGLEVHRRSYRDRWYCRIVLPDPWLSRMPGDPTLIGAARTFGRHAGFQTLPGVATPWRATLGRVAVDLGDWDDLPAAAPDAF